MDETYLKWIGILGMYAMNFDNTKSSLSLGNRPQSSRELLYNIKGYDFDIRDISVKLVASTLQDNDSSS